jgi:hypothetical protein
MRLQPTPLMSRSGAWVSCPGCACTVRWCPVSQTQDAVREAVGVLDVRDVDVPFRTGHQNRDTLQSQR